MNEKIKSDKELKQQMSQFTGTKNYYKDFMGILITDGVKWFAESLNAFWIVSDAIVIIRMKLKGEDFVVVRIVSMDNKAIITYEDSNGKILHEQKYRYADLFDAEIKLYYRDNVMMLPSEY
jgi:hypothetical protein